MLRKFIAIKIVVGVLLLTGCSSVPRAAPRFVAPSTVPIRKAIAVTQQHQANVATKLEAAQKTITLISNDCPGAKAEIDILSDDLMAAYDDNKQAELSLETAEGARQQLTETLTQQVAQANQLAKDYDQSAAKITALQKSRHGWVKRFWIATGAASLCAVWIFRKPLLAMIGGIGI